MISLTIDKDEFPFISSPKVANGENQSCDPKRAPNFSPFARPFLLLARLSFQLSITQHP
jgi:hypothetical protein